MTTWPFRPHGAIARRIVFPAVVLILLVALAACTRTRAVTLDRDAEGQPIELRREALRPYVDYLHRFFAEAYEPSNWWDVHFLSKDQKAVREEYGRPDFVRIFRSIDRERIVEWMYADKDFLCQFRRGKRVFGGPVTDLERVLLRKGYPRYSFRCKEEQGPTRQTFVYRNWMGSVVQTFSFSDGRLAGKNE